MKKHLILILPLLLAGGRSPAGDFALRDGDTVVFLGDSITAARGYSKVIENYTLLRYPRAQGPVPQRRAWRRHGRGRPEAAGSRRVRPTAPPC